MRIGIFGGTFDPVHQGHIEMALAAVSELALDEVRFVPTRPWQKTARAAESERLRMLEIALSSYGGRLVCDARELRRGGPSYSVDTLYSFRREFGENTPLYFLLGEDQWKNLTTWVLWEKFPLLANLALFQRDGGASFESEDPYKGKFPMVAASAAARSPAASGLIALASSAPLSVSSTQIRNHLKNPKTRALPFEGLNKAVQSYILDKGLYKAEGAFE